MDQIREILNFYREIGVEFLEVRDEKVQVSINKINIEIRSCQKCKLFQTKTNYVPGEGSYYPDIMFVGEGPGETEDKFGRPFIGKAGQLLEKIITKMGYSRESVFIGNVVKCRPPGNRDPLKDEVEACRPYLERQIEVLNPKVLVCLGRVAVNHLLRENYSISRIRGKVLYFNHIPLIATYHPSYVLHQKKKELISKAKWNIWHDMKKVLEIINEN